MLVPGTTDLTIQVTDAETPAMTATRALTLTIGGRTRTITGTRRGILAIRGTHTSGPVAANGSAALSICSTRLTGPVSVTASTGYILAGSDSPACGADTVTGPLTLARNTGGLELADGTSYGRS